MLNSLQIKDYALIENISIEFGHGLNIITGETGAGKSILVDAMGLLLGERASTEVVRKGSKKSIVEGIFDVKGNTKVKEILVTNEVEPGPELIVRREVSLKGSNRCFLNDTPVTLSVVKEIGDLLVDLHGQHEHQSLLRTETHIDVLDEFGSLESEIADYRKTYFKLLSSLRELKELRQKESHLSEKKELLEFQIKDIDKVSPLENEDETLSNELNILENSEKLMELSSELFEHLYDSENSIYDQLNDVKDKLSELSEIDNSFGEKVEECDSAITLINDIQEFLRSYGENVEHDPGKLDEMRERLAAIIMLKKKYGGTINSVLEHREKIGKEFDLTENFTLRLSELSEYINELRKECGDKAGLISDKRAMCAEVIEREIESELKNLGIAESVFKVLLQKNAAADSDDNYITYNKKKYRFDDRGFDTVEFFVTTNIGEDPKPLAKVASGGEISRIMLAMKSILAKNEKLPLLIFDEIDTGISGKIAQKVGSALNSLAKYHQIIAITHLPQIAGYGNSQFSVMKKKHGDRVVSTITELSNEERIVEIAKLISGENVTKTAIEGAKELLAKNPT